MPEYPDTQRLADAGIFFTPSGAKRSVVDETGGLIFIDELKAAIHRGEAYGYDAEGSIPANTSLLFLGVTGSKQLHFDEFLGDFSKGNIRITLYEDTVTSNNGTAVTPYGLNRAKVIAPTMTLYATPTVTSNGTKVAGKFLPLSGAGSNTNPQNGGIAKGKVLIANTKYLFVIQNTDANTAVSFGANFIWSESTVVLS
jgi:hypothetical protein